VWKVEHPRSRSLPARRSRLAVAAGKALLARIVAMLTKMTR
jgi:hypothetical protein